MKSSIEKFLLISSRPLSNYKLNEKDKKKEIFQSQIGHSLLSLLLIKNGSFSFEQAFHIYPFDDQVYPNISSWNALDGWRAMFDNLDKSLVFFAQDIFGNQFCVSENNIAIFNPETGEIENIAKDMETFISEILNDYEYLTGYPLAHDWQLKNRKIKMNERLVPKIPFVGGGGFEVNNLYAMDCVESMELRSGIANKIKNLSDGSEVDIIFK